MSILNKVAHVMSTKIEGFSTVRAFGFRFLFQILCITVIYALINQYHDVLGIAELGRDDFTTTIVIVLIVVAYTVYRDKSELLKNV